MSDSPSTPAGSSNMSQDVPTCATDVPNNDELEAPVPRSAPTPASATAVSVIAASTVAITGSIVNWVYDVICIVGSLSKFPIALLLLFYLSGFLFRGVVDSTVSGISPVCGLMPRLPFCNAQSSVPVVAQMGRTPSPRIRHVDFPSLMDLQSRTLNQLLSQSTVGTQLSLSVKQAELAVKDLATLVKASNLTSKVELATALEDFTHDAKVTGRGLQKLSAKLYSAVDSILAFDEYAARRITAARATAAMGGTHLDETLSQTFHSSFSVLSAEVARVILDITHFTGKLDVLEERLTAIHTICERENVLTATASDALLAELWTWLGGNRERVHRLDQQLSVLENVGRYRSLAAAHVAATTEVLTTTEADLSELREKLVAPALADEIPLEVHLASIERSARRLKEEKLRVDASWETGGHPLGRMVHGSFEHVRDGYIAGTEGQGVHTFT